MNSAEQVLLTTASSMIFNLINSILMWRCSWQPYWTMIRFPTIEQCAVNLDLDIGTLRIIDEQLVMTTTTSKIQFDQEHFHM